MERFKNISRQMFFMLIALVVLAASIGISWIIQWLLIAKCGIDDGAAGIVVSLVQGVVAAIAAGLVLYQLEIGEDIETHQSNVETAQFILEYNRSFIENEKMTEMERYMECMLTGVDYGEISSIETNRQNLINYLVYLEGLASCIHGGILDLDVIDDLFSYRFFLAMNHPEAQSIDLIPYGTYYRGCFRLYDKWMTYRMCSPKYSRENNWDIPLYESALNYRYGYEKIATPEITTKVAENKITVLLTRKKKHFLSRTPRSHTVEAGTLRLNSDGSVVCSIDEQHLPKDEKLREIQKGKLLRAMLKELLYHNCLVCSTYLDKENNLRCDDPAVVNEFTALQKAKDIMYKEGPHFRQLNGKLKLTEENLENIARLIYQTDAYIYPDMFGSEENAVKVLPKLLVSGKDSMFNLNNIYVCELDERIIGLILWYKGNLNWTSDELRSVMKEKAVAIPDKLCDVEREYVSGYSRIENNQTISLLNMCVEKKSGRRKIGLRLLNSFLEKHPGEHFELCVLSKNEGAIGLYGVCGFRKSGSEEAAYPETEPDHTRFTMRYPHE